MRLPLPVFGAFRPAGAGRVIAREHRAQHAPRFPREGVVWRGPPDMAGCPVFSALLGASSQPQSLSEAMADYRMFREGGEDPPASPFLLA